MNTADYSTTGKSFIPLYTNINNNPVAKPHGSKVVFPTLATFATVALMSGNFGYKESFPTSRLIYEPIPNLDISSSLEEPFTFTNRTEVLKYINERSNLFDLYKSLHVMIESVFGDARVHLSIFRYYEENWSNLLVKIKSKNASDDLLSLEDKLFAMIQEDDSFFAALEHVTISCG
jgi:hypothetical protein